MCDTCNCNRDESFVVHTGREPKAGHDHHHARGGHHHHGDGHSDVHTHDGIHFHSHGPSRHETTVVPVNQSILSRNDRRAERNRGHFEAKGIFVVNMISSPGAGKTTLLEKTLEALRDDFRMAVIVGDLATENDAERLRGKGADVIQVTTGTLCHLDAEMIHQSVQKLDLDNIDILFIENVGNLVCPASFDLGENARAVLLAITEGEDKPLKYPPVFKSADVVLLTKTDLAEPISFNRDQALANMSAVTPTARLIELSARVGDNLCQWLEWIGDQARQRKAAGPAG